LHFIGHRFVAVLVMNSLSNSELLEHYPYAVDLVLELGRTLQQKQWLLATAESCTGGLIAAACTDVAGSSQWFERGFVSYSNAAKTELLGVHATLIARHGAVSEPVAQAMALGALTHSPAHMAVAVTGIAGPGGGSEAKPVGTVCFGWAWQTEAGPASCRVETKCFVGNRAAVRQATVVWALQGLLNQLNSR
jgi:nicotinamide-nucleotide amidase